MSRTAPARRLNPWFSMWTRPRATIQQIVDEDPEQFVLILAALSGFSQALDRAVSRSAGDQLSVAAIFLFSALGGVVGGIITLYFGSFLLRWTGSWIGGKATAEQVRAAVAWSAVPLVWGLLLWIPELALFGDELFKAEMPRIESNPSTALLFLGFNLVEVGVAAWGIVVFLKCLGQVQAFSAWKALANVLLAVLVIAVPLGVIVGIVRLA